jgi:cytidylate kinase
LVVTIDGPAGAGKSTVARLLAVRLGYVYLDTGALYRALAWKVQTAGISPADSQAVADLLPSTRIQMEQHPDRPRIYVDSREVTDEIRTPEISRLASLISTIPAVREWLLPVQRQIGAGGGVVAEGRDLGTKVFPKADVKFFLEANEDIRAARRHQEMAAAGQAAQLNETRQELLARDHADRTRDLAPLVRAKDATVIETSALKVEQVIDRMMAVVATKL